MTAFSIDFSGLGNVNPYTDSTFTYYGNPLRMAAGVARPQDIVATAFALHSAPVLATGDLEASVTVSFASNTFKLASAVVGFFHKDTYLFYGIRFRFDAVSIRRVNPNRTVDFLGDSTTKSYTPGDTFKFRIDRSVSPPRLRASHNGVEYSNIVSPVTDFSNYRAGFFVQHDSGSNTGGITAFSANGLSIAAPQSIKLVGEAGSINQYQKAVSVTVDGLDTANLESMTFAGEAYTPTVVNSTSFTFDAPGDLASGTYAVAATFDAGQFTKTATYVQTHPIDVPDAGTAVHADSILAQLGNPNNNRWLKLNKPAGLDWKAPHTSFTADNISLAISELFTARPDAAAGTNYQATGSVLDDTGAATDFIMTFTVEEAPNDLAFRLIIVPTYQDVYAKVAI